MPLNGKARALLRSAQITTLCKTVAGSDAWTDTLTHRAIERIREVSRGLDYEGSADNFTLDLEHVKDALQHDPDQLGDVAIQKRALTLIHLAQRRHAEMLKNAS